MPCTRHRDPVTGDHRQETARVAYRPGVFLRGGPSGASRAQTAGGASRPANSAPGRERSSSRLSTREHEIVSLVAQGFKNQDLASKLSLSEQTVKNHLHT